MKERKLGMTAAVAGALVVSGLGTWTLVRADVSLPELKNQYGPELEALGEVQSIDVTAGFVVVAGQRIAISRQTMLLVDQNVVELAKGLSAIKVGDLLAVSGDLGAPATTIRQLTDSYVAGSTPVYVRGRIVSINKSVGYAKLDALTVDFTPAMSSPGFPKFDLGEIIEATGVQPSTNGKLLASDVAPGSIAGTSLVKPASIAGTSKVEPASIAGTSLVKPASIAGTSKIEPASIAGTSLVKPGSIAGTSKVAPASIAGTSLVKPASIAGTSF
jgi:hypothetical protein